MQFPKDFLFGVADADLQVVGEDIARKEEDSEETMWSRYCAEQGKEKPGRAIDRFHNWKQDIGILRDMGIKNYRTSISMARTLKRSGEVNSKAIKWYRNFFKELNKHGIRIYATLYHWELPQYAYEWGGWKNKKTTDLFLKHARVVAETLGEYIEEYFVLNEPRCSSLVAHYYGAHAPGEKNLSSALHVAHNLLLAQGAVFRDLHSLHKDIKISTVVNLGARYAATTDPADVHAAVIADAHKNSWFTYPLFLGKYPDEILSVYEKYLPENYQNDTKDMYVGDRLHSLGMNYYRGDIVRHDTNNELGFRTELIPNGTTTDLGWGVYVPPYYQEGLYDILNQTYFRYRDNGLKRIYIAENGIALNSILVTQNGTINDEKRIWYYNEHIKMVNKALKNGIPVKGYFAWSLMDNFEWSEGYKPDSSFGLIHVDMKTMERKWKKSAYWYKNLVATHKLSV